MNPPADQLAELQRQLYALADQLETEPTHIVESEDWQARSAYKDRIHDQYAKTASDLLIEAYTLGGFQTNPKWRNILAIWRKSPDQGQILFWRMVNEMTSTILGLPHQSHWWWETFNTEATSLRVIASRILLPSIDPTTRRNWRRYRKNLYRLPKEQRTVRSPYQQLDYVNRAGEAKSIKDALKQPEKVWRLNLSGGVSADDFADIGRLVNLRILDISQNNLSTLPNSILQLSKLTHLDASNNQITELPTNIDRLVKLRHLNLDGNSLMSLPESVGSLSCLCDLSIARNQFSTLLEWIGRLNQLKSLNLSFNQLNTLPETISDLISLESLNLYHNQLSTLPEGIGNLTRLRRLILSTNRLTTLPESLDNLRELELLVLRTNPLVSLPERIGDLTKLKTLRVSRSQLKTLPESIGNLTSLTSLDLIGNLLVDLPDSVAQLRLSTLFLTGNPHLTALPPGLKVQRLNISDCPQLKSLPDDIGITEWIEVAGSGLTSLPKYVNPYGLRWQGVRVTPQIAFAPETITAQQVLNQPNAEVRRVMLERMGFEKFMREAKTVVLDADRDPGGRRRLLRVPMNRDEPIVCLEVSDPSTGRKYLLRVPPTTRTCHQAAAWIAGFDNPDDYHPLVET